jgi:2-polyprenyl-3-methyl-5-hydroxy-6-metoxy-1,4-benzoquinol methylase
MGKVYSSELKRLFFDISHFDFGILRIYLDYLRVHVSSECLRILNLSSESFIWAHDCWELGKRSKPVYGEKRSKCTRKSVHFALDTLKRRFTEKLQLIDVGCGPSSHFYSEELANRADIEITTVDPLAKHYQKLHRQYKTPYNIKCVEGFGENLVQLFSKDSFHLVYSQNAIDHSVSP